MTSQRSTLHRRAALCALALAAPLIIADAPNPADLHNSAEFDDRLLAAQNAERARLNLRPLHWSARLAADAAVWAQRLVNSRRFEHSPQPVDDPEGENIWGGTRGYSPPPEAIINDWTDERKYFKPGSFPDNSTTGNVADVGHFTQIIWRNTAEVGCFMAENAQYDVLVCRYFPCGNYMGEKPY